MEQSKSISIIIAKLKLAYPYYFQKLFNEEFTGLIALYQDNLSKFNESTLANAVNSIIKRSEFMPTIKEIIDECESNFVPDPNVAFVIQKMIDVGYFRNQREIEKTYHFIKSQITPKWLLEDMKKYGYASEIKLGINETLKIS